MELGADASYHGEFDRMGGWAERGLDAARASGERAIEVAALAGLAAASQHSGEPDRGVGLVEEAQESFESLSQDELASRPDAAFYLGMAELFCDRYETGAAHLSRGIEIAPSFRCVGLRVMRDGPD